MKLITTTICSLTSCLLFADSETYLSSVPNLSEWKPPTRTEKVLPDRVVKKTHVVGKDGRHVCIEECETPVESVKISSEAEVVVAPQAQPTQVQGEDYVAPKLLFISATVYKEGERSFSHIRLQCEGEKAEAWSSMNFMEMAGMNHYVARGVEYITHVGHGMEESISASEAGCPVNREKLNQEKARFVPLGDTSEQTHALEAMRGLHAIYNKEHEAIKAAYQVRLVNQEKASQWHAENPPKPKDITVRFWKRETQTEEK